MEQPDSPTLADRAAGWRSAYIHIPFCRRRCPYCDFAVVAPGDAHTADLPDLTARYLGALHSEIDMEPEWGPLDAVNFGGGTPSAVGAGAIAEIVGHLQRRFHVAADAEISVEVNPEDVTPELVAGLAAAGVNRVSIGVQSFDAAVLRYLGRAHSPQTAAAAVAMCRRRFACGVDLIFGTPGESLDSWQATVAAALAGEPDHVSIYALTIEPGTELWRTVRAGATPPDPDDQADKYELFQEAARGGGLVQYEVSNFSRPGFACRYNLATWGQGEYLGFGLGAHGHRDGVRTRNVRSIRGYLKALGEGRRPEAGREATADRQLERVTLGIRRTCGVALGDLEEPARRHEGLQRLQAARVIEIVEGRLRVLRPLLTDEVGATFLSLSP